MQINNSKKQIKECIEFCPDLRLLHHILFSLKDDKRLIGKQEQVRIRTLMKRVKSYIASSRSRNWCSSFSSV